MHAVHIELYNEQKPQNLAALHHFMHIHCQDTGIKFKMVPG